MTIKNAQREREISRRLRAVAECPSEGFRDLLIAGGFDLRKDLRYRNLSGMSFAGEDLRGIDFTGADISECTFLGALIFGSKFDRAILGRASFDSNEFDYEKLAAVSTARDWWDYCLKWTAEREIGNEDMPVGSMFQDAPFAPLMVVLPAGENEEGLAMSLSLIGTDDVNNLYDALNQTNQAQFDVLKEAKYEEFNGPTIGNIVYAKAYCEALSQASQRSYRFPTESELNLAQSMGTPLRDFSLGEFTLDATSGANLGGLPRDRLRRLVDPPAQSSKGEDNSARQELGGFRVVRNMTT